MDREASGWVAVPGRAVVRVTGPDRVALLNGLVTADVRRLAPDRALYSLLLTAQGRYQHDFFMADDGADAWLIDVAAARAEGLVRTLSRYRLRAKVAFDQDGGGRYVVLVRRVGQGGAGAQPGQAKAWAGGTIFTDPRLAELGERALVPAEAVAPLAGADAEGVLSELQALRLSSGVPDGEADLIPDRSSPLEFNLDHLHAIAFDKGCYLGQEPTARGRYRGLVRKRLLPATISGPLPAPGTPVLCGDREAGEVRSGQGQRLVAVLRLEEVERAAADGLPLTAGTAVLSPSWPAWLEKALEGPA